MPQSSQDDHQIVNLKDLPHNQRDQVLADIQRLEKHTFPTHEAMTFDAALVSKQKVSLLLVPGQSAAMPILAYAVCVRHHRRCLLEKLCVHQKYRQKGIGADLLSSVVALALRTACTGIDLWVDEARLVATRLYQKHGFVQRDMIKDYYCPGRNALKMSFDIH